MSSHSKTNKANVSCFIYSLNLRQSCIYKSLPCFSVYCRGCRCCCSYCCFHFLHCCLCFSLLRSSYSFQLRSVRLILDPLRSHDTVVWHAGSKIYGFSFFGAKVTKIYWIRINVLFVHIVRGCKHRLLNFIGSCRLN